MKVAITLRIYNVRNELILDVIVQNEPPALEEIPIRQRSEPSTTHRNVPSTRNKKRRKHKKNSQEKLQEVWMIGYEETG